MKLFLISMNFTFQYVSINTTTVQSIRFLQVYFTFQYVSINTQFRKELLFLLPIFTFQYVSINTCPILFKLFLRKQLYIPICFY